MLLVIPKTLTYFEKEFPKQRATQITVTAPETDYKRNTTINGTLISKLRGSQLWRVFGVKNKCIVTTQTELPNK